MTYDALGRLTQVVAGSSTANYTYDALDRLRTINVGSATNRFRYVGTTDAVAQILDNVASTVLTNHATDLDGTELFDFAPGGSSQLFLGRNDHGDVTWSATTTGAVSARVSYDPYGNVAASSGTTPASRWQGSYYDSTSGFYYVNARWYAPSLGTFLSEDPLTHEITDPASRDEYAYGSGDAVDMTDVSGESGCDGTYHDACLVEYWNRQMTMYQQKYWRWVDKYMVTKKRRDEVSKPCTETIGSKGCLLTSLAMVLDAFYRHIDMYDENGKATGGNQLPDPLTLDYWLNVQTHDHGKDANLIGRGSCNIDLMSGRMDSRLGIYVKKLPVHHWLNYWSQMQGKGGLAGTIESQLRQWNLVIALVPGAPTHYVVIKGWEKWSFSGRGQGKSREFDSEKLVAKTKKRAAHYQGLKADFIIADPESKDPERRLFANYGAIEKLYSVRPA
jgi:RHS repeat-associated protein